MICFQMKRINERIIKVRVYFIWVLEDRSASLSTTSEHLPVESILCLQTQASSVLFLVKPYLRQAILNVEHYNPIEQSYGVEQRPD